MEKEPAPANGTAATPYPAKLAWYKALLCLVGLPVRTASPKLRNTPLATYLLSCIIFLLSIWFWHVFHSGSANRYIFDPKASGITWLSGLLAYGFFHADLFHLLGNLYFLVLFGRHVECRFGSRRFIGLFIISSMAGAISHGMFSDSRLIGASSGVFGILLFHALLLPKARVLWLPFGPLLRIIVFSAGWRLLRKGFPMPFYVAAYLLLQLVILVEQLYGDGRVSALGHLGGAIAGVLIYKGWRKGWLP